MDEVFHLEMKAGSAAGRRFSVRPEGSRAGRARRNEISVDDNLLSRHHCRFYFKDGHLFVQDLDSANGTMVNARAVRDVRLAVGDIVAIGGTLLKVLHDGERSALRLQAPGPAAVHSGSPRDVQSRVEAVLDEERPLPLFVRSAAWIIMALWWAFLAYSLLGPVARREKAAPPSPRPADQAAATALPAPADTDGMTQRLREMGISAQQLGQLDALKRTVTDSLEGEDYARALELVALAASFQNSDAARREILALSSFVREVSRVDDLIAEAFVERIGSETTIRRGESSISFVPKAVAGRQVSGKYLGPEGERLLTFKISSLTPAERSRWLGKADTPERCAMQCILQMRAGDYVAARILAANAGPLADALTEKIAAQPDS